MNLIQFENQNLMLIIKLIATDERGRAMVIPCHIAPQIIVDVDAYLQTIEFEPSTLENQRLVIWRVLSNIERAFGVPLGWFAAYPDRMTKEQFFATDKLKTQIDLTFSEPTNILPFPGGNPANN